MDDRLPPPTLVLTLPSLHDGTTLDCRLYHPASLAASPRAPPWRRHAAVVAHPYAPLGGSQDDAVVDVVAATLLRLGFLVATFNFRGAGGSAGRTSWTAKAERADYMSVAGFVFYYAHHHLDPFRFRPKPSSPTGIPASPSQPATPSTPSPAGDPILLLCGYSYGATVTTLLPPLSAILAPLATPAAGTAAAEIRQRAAHLATSQNTVLSSARAAAQEHRPAGRKSLGVRVGGDEDLRRSHESGRRSFSLEAEEKFRELIAKAKPRHHRYHSGDGSSHVGSSPGKKPTAESDKAAGDGPALPLEPDLPATRAAYLLVSPPIGVAASLATMSFSLPFSRKLSHRGSTPGPESSEPPIAADADRNLADHPTLAIFGDADVFLSSKKAREWAARLGSLPNSQFRAHEVSTAGHFWTEGRTLNVLRDAVGAFAEGLLQGKEGL